MKYSQFSESTYRTKSESALLLRGQFLEQSSAHEYIALNLDFYGQSYESEKPKTTTTKIVRLNTVSLSRSNYEAHMQRPFIQAISRDNVTFNVMSSAPLLSNLDLHIKGFIIEDPKALSKADKALGTLHERTRELAEGIFFNIRAVPPTRAPGFVIDGWIIVPEYSRELEHKIYEELGEVIRTNPSLLFSIHVVARRGRELKEILPRNYKRYTNWPEYVC